MDNELGLNAPDAENGKPKRTRAAKLEKRSRRSRATVVQVSLSGEVANWVKTEAAANFRDHAGQVAYCVATMMSQSAKG